jgi:hypothetical protein
MGELVDMMKWLSNYGQEHEAEYKFGTATTGEFRGHLT